MYERINRLLSDIEHRPTPIIVVEAAAGKGKSQLAQRVLAACDSMRLTALTGAGDSFEASTPHFALLSILRSVFAQQELLCAP